MKTSNWKRIALGGLAAVGLALAALAAGPATANPCPGCTVAPPRTVPPTAPPSVPPRTAPLPDLVAQWVKGEWLAAGQFRAAFGWGNPTLVEFPKPVTVQVTVDGVVRATKTTAPTTALTTASWYADFPLAVGPGVHSLCATVNPPPNLIDEVTHSNNTVCATFLPQPLQPLTAPVPGPVLVPPGSPSVVARPDLVAEILAGWVADGLIRYTVRVSNAGTAPAGPFCLRFYWVGGPVTPACGVTYEAGFSVTVETGNTIADVPLVSTAPKLATHCLELDFAHEVAEMDESNNTACRIFTLP